MSIVDLLDRIRSAWINRVVNQLARGEGVRENFMEQVHHFYNLLVQAIESGEPAWLDSLIKDWVYARTQSDLESQENSLSPMFNWMLLALYEVAGELLESDQALQVIGACLPVFAHAQEHSALLETRLHVQHVTQELYETRVSLERLEKSKSDFISVAAHELKTPLTLIDGYAAMLNEVIQNGVDRKPQAEIYLSGVHAGARRLKEIVDDMIDVSLIDNNMLSLNYQPVWLNRILESVKTELSAITLQRDLNYTIHTFPGINEMFFGDGERLYQAFRNVILNAIKFTPDGGSITIAGRMLPGFVEVIIKDTGIGIAAEFHSRIFEKFGRLGDVALHSSSKTKFKGGGPGLGLPIAKGIIDAHGGTIWVESEGYDERKFPGSTFHIMLPLRKSPPDDKSAKLFGSLIKEDG